MLENGAELRYIQRLLGHAQVTMTQLYTQVSIHKLKEVHALTHPGARLVPNAAEADSSLAADATQAQNDDARGGAEALHAVLQVEADAEDDG